MFRERLVGVVVLTVLLLGVAPPAPAQQDPQQELDRLKKQVEQLQRQLDKQKAETSWRQESV